MDYKDLDAWKKACLLCQKVVKTLKSVEVQNRVLANQLYKSAISVPSNIAEGMGRQYAKEKIHFLHIARGSSYELETQLLIADRCGIARFSVETQELMKDVQMLIQGWIRHLKRESHK